MAKDGVQFEVLLHEIYTILAHNDHFTSIERNVQLDGPDGPRQIDILIRSSAAGIQLMTVVECRDHNRILDLIAVDGFQSKLIDVRANKGILVSRKGFSKNARRKAERLGITLCTASDASTILASIEKQIPIVITEIAAHLSTTKAKLKITGEATFDGSTMFRINDKWIPDLFRDDVLAGAFTCPLESCTTIDWLPHSISPPFFRKLPRQVDSSEVEFFPADVPPILLGFKTRIWPLLAV